MLIIYHEKFSHYNNFCQYFALRLQQSSSTGLKTDTIEFNLGFEKGSYKWKSSVDWQTGTTESGYKVEIDSNQKYSGKYSLLIENIEKNVDSKSGMSNIIIPAKFEGKEVEKTFATSTSR